MIKRKLLLLIAALATLAASAQTKVEINGIWYNLVSKAKQAEVTFKGDSYDSYNDEYSGSITIPATVTYNGVAYSVTSIGDGAFDGCSSLTAITIPEGVTSIGDYAFYSCRSLTSITIPKGVTSIEYGAFEGCSSLTSIILPEGVKSIGIWAFSGCSSLTSITISEGVTSIGCNAFDGCSSLTAITIPEGVTSIGVGAFYECSSLTDITLPESVTSIEVSAFYGCRSLTSITIPEGVTSIEESAFYNCTSLTAITLPKSVEYVNSNAFADCPKLSDVYCYAETVPGTEAYAFDVSLPEYATLHVPASAMNDYKTTAPWSWFGNIVVLADATPLEKCTTPVISYVDGKVVFACDTDGAIVESNFKDNNASDYSDSEVLFIPTYTITAYATKAQHKDSDITTVTLCWLPCTEEYEEDNGILTIPSKPVLIGTQGGVITVSGLAAGTAVAAYDTMGTPLATATTTNGTATLSTGLEAGNIAIVKMGDYSVKVAIK